MRMLRRLWSGIEDIRGNVAITFSIAAIPVIGLAGAALDYSMANASRASMQKALDTTALAVAKLMPTSQAELDRQGWLIFTASAGRVHARINQGDLVITTSANGKIDLRVTGQHKAYVVGLIGMSEFPVSAHSQVQWGLTKLELALALDNTGSMATANKMAELKKAAKNLLTSLQKAAKNPGDIKVSIVPFNTQVNVNKSNVNQTWLDFTAWDTANQTCTVTGGKKDKKGSPTPTCTAGSRSTWDGCVMDRDQSNDVSDTTPAVALSTLFPAVQCANSLAAIMPLSYDWTALSTHIDTMTPSGYTNVTIGLAWALHTLTISQPMTEAAPPSVEYKKAIILMTDGQNTANRWSTAAAEIDARTALACANVKSAGIDIYTIRVIDGNETLLRNCASDPSKYFNVQNAADLSAVFTKISETLAKLHLSQ